jgi:acyl dehydratase
VGVEDRETIDFADVSVGQMLPDLEIPITVELIVTGAIATRDFTDVHHDKSAAERQGMPDVFMNILTTNGLVARLVTDWAGPLARLAGIAIRLGAPNLPGDTMTLGATVAAKELVDDRGFVDVDIVGKNSHGNHVTGSVRVELPRSS